ncbi:MAG: 2'-5' RNA ligase family protein [Candidatus Kapabacteria bacterium]|jgi:hypothetical protein|nr:2'-5' RNA ligase family protein [Candidatus Kapabacteria bacterium]
MTQSHALRCLKRCTFALITIILQSPALLLSQNVALQGHFAGNCAVKFDVSIHQAAPFLVHTGNGAFDNYLAMNLPYPPAEALWKSLEKQFGTTLKNRGEAHITVISPPEFSNVLGKVLTIQEINDIALTMKIQNARFTPVCLGRAQVVLDGKAEQTYYVVVRSDDLLAIRRAIFEKFCAKGGEISLWDPHHFYPHITIGYTKQDLHEEGNGVRKGVNSCFCEIVP